MTPATQSIAAREPGGLVAWVTGRPVEPLLTPDDVMARVGGYRDRSTFLRMTRAQGLPRIKLNRRVIRFERQAVETWLRRRSVGG